MDRHETALQSRVGPNGEMVVWMEHYKGRCRLDLPPLASGLREVADFHMWTARMSDHPGVRILHVRFAKAAHRESLAYKRMGL